MHIVSNDGQILLTDKNTGQQTNRRMSEGMHTSLEVKHRDRPNVKISVATGETTGKIASRQAFEDLFKEFGGFSGSAIETSAQDAFRESFGEKYRNKNYVVDIPDSTTKVREERRDVVFRNFDHYYEYLVDQIISNHDGNYGAPMLNNMRDAAMVQKAFLVLL